MSISAILNSSSNQYQIGAASNPYQQEIQQLGQALQSGNLSAAQSDFATLQAAFSQPATTTAGSTSNPVAQAFNQLGTAVNVLAPASGKVVNHSYAQARGEQRVHQVRADKAAATGHQHETFGRLRFRLSTHSGKRSPAVASGRIP